MGIDTAVARVLLALPRFGVDFSRTLTIGRQVIYMDAGQLAGELKRAGYSGGHRLARELLQEGNGYAEPLLRMLGAARVESLDVSSYEQASLLHDLNQPLPADRPPPFTLVIDSGTLEHIFNATVALQNLMDLTASGGHLLIAVPANNQLGHGFYQFGPDFFSGGLSDGAGFQIRRMYLASQGWLRLTFFSIPPTETYRRLQSRARGRAELVVIARRMPRSESRLVIPAQAEYAAWWADGGAPSVGVAVSGPHRRWGLWQRLLRAGADRWWIHKGRYEFPKVEPSEEQDA